MAVSEDTVTTLLDEIGEDVHRDGLRDTPRRVSRAWTEWTSGYHLQPGDVLKEFEGVNYDQLIVVRDIRFYSQCEHHLAPFFGVAHVGYIPWDKIVGLSKLARLVDIYAHRLQVQERMTWQIAQALTLHLKPRGVGVVIEARHLCMESRGLARPGAVTVTSALEGCIREEPDARAEFLALTRSSPNVAV